jgi:transposase-like protein
MPRRTNSKSPPFCPNPNCDSRTNSGPWRFKKKGFYLRDQKPHRIQRYQCHHCGRNFSSQTFETSYWLRHAQLLSPVFHRLVSCSGLRQIAREFRVSHHTIQRLSEKLGRHCILFHENIRPRRSPDEPLVLDGLRSFEHSQYWPMDLNLLVGPSHYVYGFNDAELRRSGTMRPAQKRKRQILEKRYGRPDPQATQKQVTELLARIVPKGGSAILRSDEHPSYPRAIAQLGDRSFEHERTSSKASRTTRNPLFPANHADLLLRHSSANHKRETIAFSKRRQGALYRLATFVVWKNYIKCRSENRRDAPPAKLLGLTRRALTVSGILSERLFPDRARISGWVERCYFGRIKTRAIAKCTVHKARFAI